MTQQVASLADIVHNQQSVPAYPQYIAGNGNGGGGAPAFIPPASQNISQLVDTRITNPTITGGSVACTSVAATTLSASGNTSLATTSITGDLTVTSTTTTSGLSAAFASVTKLAAAAVFGNDLTYSRATFSDATSTNLAATNAAVTNATTTNLAVTKLAVTHTLVASGNVLSSDVGGSVGTSSIITSSVASSSANVFQTIVNGLSSNLASIINSLSTAVAGNTLTTTVNGVAATTTVITSHGLALSGTLLTSTVNGVATTTDLGPVLSAGTTHALSGSTGILFSTVNGATATTSITTLLNGESLSLSTLKLPITSTLLATNGLGQIVATTTLPSSLLALPQGYTLRGNSIGAAEATSTLFIANNGNVGIGTTSPGQLLSVAGDILGNNHIGSFFTATNTAATSTLAGGLSVAGNSGLTVLQNGNVGIGTTAPFTIGGTPKLSIAVPGGTGPGPAMTFGVDDNDLLYIRRNGAVGEFVFQTWKNTNSGVLALQPYGGNVGIGTTSPGQLLSVAGDILGNNHIGSFFTATNTAATSTLAGGLSVAGSSGLTVLQNGNVGIGTTAPRQALEVNGLIQLGSYGSGYAIRGVREDASTGKILWVNGAASGNMLAGATILDSINRPIQFAINGVPTATILTSGNVGIGTTTPDYALTVNQNGQVSLTGGGGGVGLQGQIRFGTFHNSGTASAYNPSIYASSFNPTSGYLVFRTNNAVDTMVVGYTGNVGIGTTTPQNPLHVYVNNSTTGTGQLRLEQAGAGNAFLQIGQTGGNAYALGVDHADSDKFKIGWAATSFPGVATQSRFTIDTSGNVGIGTTSPTSKFHIADSVGGVLYGTIENDAGSGTTANAGLRFVTQTGTGIAPQGYLYSTANSWTYQGYGANSMNLVGMGTGGTNIVSYNASGAIRFLTAGEANSNERMRIDANGNVGIGTTSPQYPLDIGGRYGGNYANITGYAGNNPAGWMASADNSTRVILSQFGSASTNNFFGNNASGFGVLYTPNVVGQSGLMLGTVGSAPIIFGAGNTEKMRILSGGNVGIGTTSPGQLLSVAGDILGNNHIGSFFTATNTTATTTFAGGLTAGGATGLTVLQNGNVGIGTTAPGDKFNIVGNVGATGDLYLDLTSTGEQGIYGRLSSVANRRTGSGIIFDNTANTSGYQGGQLRFQTAVAGVTGTLQDRMVIDTSGNVGIGTTSPTTALQVAGVITPNQDNTSSLGSATYRWSALYAANGTIQTSDVRLKDNVTDLKYGLADLLKLRPVSFTWKDHGDQGTKLGFIAQEVQPLMPEIVNTGDDPNHTLGISYTEFIPAIVKGVQELAAKISDTAHLVVASVTANTLTASDRICIGSGSTQTCITQAQLAALLSQTAGASLANPTPTTTASSTSRLDSATLTLNGNNPVTWPFGTPWSDNLGATFSYGGIAETIYSTSTIDTAVAGTTTIDYWATWYADPASPASAHTLHVTRDVILLDPSATTPL